MLQIKLPKPKEPETRTTCKLTDSGQNALHALIDEYGLTHKQVCSSILENAAAIEAAIKKYQENKTLCKGNNRKCLVIGNQNLVDLREISRSTGVSRDTFIDAGIILLHTAFQQLKDDIRKKYSNALTPLHLLLEQAESIETDLMSHLDADDPFLARYSEVCVLLTNLVDDLYEATKR